MTWLRAPDVGRTEPGAIVVRGLHALASDPELAWEPFRPGVDIHRLYAWSTGQSAALLRYAAGVGLPPHRHAGTEQVLILSGTQTDANGTHHAGTMVVHPSGSVHSVRTETGCVVLAIWEQPVEFTSVR